MALSLEKEQFVEICVEVLNELRDELETDALSYDISILQECFIRSEVTAGLFQLDDGVNYYREAGQYCYWIRKLKPFSCSIELEFLLNELAGFLVSSEVIRLSQSEIVDILMSNGKTEEASLCVSEIDQNNIRIHRLEATTTSSLRYHVHSSGGIPTLLEALYSIQEDKTYAWGNLN